MKQLLIGGLIFGSLIACSDGNAIEVTVTDSDDTYEFFAKYDRHKTQRVQDFINAKMAPGSDVTGDHIDITTTLDDHTKFKLEEDADKVRIELDKDDNSEASYKRVKKMCEGIKRVIMAK